MNAEISEFGWREFIRELVRQLPKDDFRFNGIDSLPQFLVIDRGPASALSDDEWTKLKDELYEFTYYFAFDIDQDYDLDDAAETDQTTFLKDE